MVAVAWELLNPKSKYCCVLLNFRIIREINAASHFPRKAVNIKIVATYQR